VKLKWNVANMDGAVPKGRDIELFRVVQEALNNIVKHSNAANARVELRRDTARWVLEIDDDGRGFDESASGNGKPSGFGLRGMRERIRILGGTLTIDSRPGEGTRLRAEAPISRT
jgi:signal transduction histidine kinase